MTRSLQRLLFIVLPLSLISACGCSSDRKDNSRSVVDSLADLERSKNEFTVPPAGSSTAETAVADEATSPSAAGTFKVRFETTAGDFVVEAHREWAPLGAERFYQLVKSGYYDECRFFRVLPGFMVQFGIHGDPATQQEWDRNLKDDPATQSNKKGYVTFATAGPNTRTTQIFINYADNKFLDSQGFSPFGEVIEGMHNAEGIYSGYGEMPDQGQITNVGNSYLERAYPDLDYVKKATIIEDAP